MRPIRRTAWRGWGHAIMFMVLALAVAESARAEGLLQGLFKMSRPAVATSQPETIARIPAANTAQASESSKWLTDLDTAYSEARRANRPILIRAGATWCGWCRKLDEVVAQSEVQASLSQWTCVYLDVDLYSEEAQRLSVGPIPALRALTPTGRLVSSHDGYLPADGLISWLSKAHEHAAVRTLPLVDGSSPDQDAVRQLVVALSERDAVLRERAIRWLVDHPDVAVGPVTDAFMKGDLATRLGCLELLADWQAPVIDLDPWRPETLTDTRLGSLRQWANSAGSVMKRTSLTDAQRQELRLEIARMLQADDPLQVVAMRDRMARLGSPLLPMVCEYLKKAPTDRDYERLTALRYALVARRGLSVSWPGGLERLASTEAHVRQDAVRELVSSVSDGDTPLLLELFSNTDPLVREMSLRALREVAGPGATDALVSLLGDPEPNVRAAVLKELAGYPSAGLAEKIGEYAAEEQDPDLVVHAIRALRAAGGDDALKHLARLAEHAQWQVRAETADAIGECLLSGVDLESAHVEAGLALVKLLKDDDDFVSSRAAAALTNVDVDGILDQLVAVVGERPELAPLILSLLADAGEFDMNVVRHLQGLFQYAEPGIRAAAISALCESALSMAEAQLPVALADSDLRVRLAAATSFVKSLSKTGNETRHFDVIELDGVARRRPPSGLVRGIVYMLSGNWGRPPPQGEVYTPVTSTFPAGDYDRFVRFLSGEGRPKWMDNLAEPLEAMLAADLAEERLAGAMALVPLGQQERAWPVIQEAIRSRPEWGDRIVPVLPWLETQARHDLFSRITKQASAPELLIQAIQSLVVRPGEQADQLLWTLFDRGDVSPELAGVILNALRVVYFGDRFDSSSRISAECRDRAAAEGAARARSGSELQRVVALAIVLHASRERAAEIASEVFDDPRATPQLRADALQIMLLSQPVQAGRSLAANMIVQRDGALRERALRFLVEGGLGYTYLRETNIWLRFDNPELDEARYPKGGQPISPAPPEGLEAAPLRGLLDNDDPASGAMAGYLLCLLKEPEGLDPLVSYWREYHRDDPAWARLVFRAVAALNDERQLPLLEDVYKEIDPDDRRMREFYWTIRSMEGEQISAFRLRIRREVGMERLR